MNTIHLSDEEWEMARDGGAYLRSFGHDEADTVVVSHQGGRGKRLAAAQTVPEPSASPA